MKNLMVVLFLVCMLCGVQLYGEAESNRGALVIILMGPPGSGKGTQAVKLSQKLKLPHISTGDLFRENIKNQTSLGKQANAFISQGKLVPDEITLNMLLDRASKPDSVNGYLLDGFPRTVAQAEAFEKQLNGIEPLVLNLEVSDAVMIQRAVGRLMCKACGHIQHREFSPPKIEGRCDKCGGELFQRADDTEEVIRERLKVYHQQTEPVIAYYSKKGLVSHINGERSPEEVFQELVSSIKQN